MNGIIRRLAKKDSLVLCSYILDELHEVVNSKFSNKSRDLEKFLLEIPFELVYTPQTLPQHNLFAIRDTDDEKVLFSAVLADVDVLITGDKDFFDIEIERPEILTPSEFMRRYG